MILLTALSGVLWPVDDVGRISTPEVCEKRRAEEGEECAANGKIVRSPHPIKPSPGTLMLSLKELHDTMPAV